MAGQARVLGWLGRGGAGLSTQATLQALWLGTGLAWAVIAVLLARGLDGRARVAALGVHGLTPVAILLISAQLGLGLLYAIIALAAEWWALALVTRLRPERLADPGRNGLAMLAGWLGTTALLACGLTAWIF